MQKSIRVLVMFVLATLVLALSACTIEVVERAADAQAAPTTAAEETTTVSATQPGGILTGTVTYRQRIALPSGSVVEVKLQDVSRADASAQVIASQTITTTGENVPIPFALSYDPAQIDPRSRYTLSVRITTNGELRWINTERYDVLTHEAPLTGVEVVVQPVQ
jgi:putative lipoprotein